MSFQHPSLSLPGQPELTGQGSEATRQAEEHAGAAAPPVEAMHQVTSLLKVSSYLVSVLNPDEIQANLISRLVEALPSVHGGILWLYDRRGARLRAVSSYGLPLDLTAQTALMSGALAQGEGLAGQALLQGEPMLRETRQGYRDTAERSGPSSQALLHQLHEQLPRTLSIICIPLRIGNEMVGVIELMNLGDGVEPAPRRPLSRDDIPVFQTFGNLAASAIKNAQLYDQAESHRLRLKAFDAVVTAISAATGLHDLVHSVLDVVLELLPGTAGAILLLDPSQARLTLLTERGLPVGYADLLMSIAVAGASCEEVVRYGQPMLRPLLEEEGEGALILAGYVSGAYLPLLAGGTVVGVLGLFGDEQLPRRTDTATLMPICNQIGFAVANVRIYEDNQIERKRLNMVINSIVEGVVVCDSQGQLVLANEAAMEMLSLEAVPYAQTLSEMPDFYGIRDLDNQPLPVEKLPLALALSGRVFHDYRVFLRGASGSDSVMSFSGSPVYDGSGAIEGAVVIFRDITANQKLERAKDEFLAVAAHELRSPLAAVRSYADLLLRREQQRSEADPRDLQGLTILTQQVSHMLRMVDNLLDVSRLDAGRLDLQIQRVNLVTLAQQVLDQQRPAAASRELEVESSDPELWILCDPLRIRQVLTNLVGNAIKFSPPDSSISVRLETAVWEQIGSECQAPDDVTAETRMVVVAVSDTGPGIPAEQRTRLFQRFYRGQGRRAEGLGLGLYLSREFIQMHSGCIWVRSSDGQGSTFLFTLPLGQ